VQKQIELIKQLINYNLESPLNKALRQLVKAAKSTIYNIILLQHQMNKLYIVNEKQKQKRIAT
jgi:hypothetical protein